MEENSGERSEVEEKKMKAVEEKAVGNVMKPGEEREKIKKVNKGDMSGEEGEVENGNGESGENASGICKWFNVSKGFGFITPDDGSQEVFVHQSVLEMPGFRSLEEGERLQYSWRAKTANGRREATRVTGVEGAALHGSTVRPLGKRREKLIRCFNCGEYGNHVASKCKKFPAEKVCYNCRSPNHLVGECPEPVQHRSAGVRKGNTANTAIADVSAAEKLENGSGDSSPTKAVVRVAGKSHPDDPGPTD